MGLCLEKEVDSNLEKQSLPKIQAQENVQQKQEQLIIQTEQMVEQRLQIKFEVNERVTRIYYILCDPLGSGVWGEASRAQHKKTQQMRAIKKINRWGIAKPEWVFNHFEILQKLDHPNIIEFQEFYQDDKFLYVVTELCQGGDLFERIHEKKTFSEQEAAQLMQQLLGTIHYMHEAKIMHRHITPENILFQSPNKEKSLIKLIGFSNATNFILNQKFKLRIGTPYYIAPEVIEKNYDEKCDIWSLGVILYILFSGYFFKQESQPPFPGKNDSEIMDAVRKGEYNFDSQEWINISVEAKELIQKMICYDPMHRYSAYQCLQTPWLKKLVVPYKIDSQQLKTVSLNIINFRLGNKLQEAVQFYILKNLIAKVELEMPTRLYLLLNSNYEQGLSKQALIDGFTGSVEPDDLQNMTQHLFSTFDKSKQLGYIKYSDFLLASIDKNRLLSENLIGQAFETFDKKDRKALSIKEFQNMFEGLSSELWQGSFQSMNLEGDRNISVEEFQKFMQNLDYANT